MRKSNRKWIFSLGLCLTLTLFAPMTAYAEPEQMRTIDKDDGGKMFDAQYYAEAYPDVVAKVGTDVHALYEYHINHGIAEGRTDYPVLSDMGSFTVTPMNKTMYRGHNAFYYTSLKNGSRGTCQLFDYNLQNAGFELNKVQVTGLTSNGFYVIPSSSYVTDHVYVRVEDLYDTQAEAMATYVPSQSDIRDAIFAERYGDGSDLAFTGTYTLPNSGITMPKLNKFNTAGLNPHYLLWGPIDEYGYVEYDWVTKNLEYVTDLAWELAEKLEKIGWLHISRNERENLNPGCYTGIFTTSGGNVYYDSMKCGIGGYSFDIELTQSSYCYPDSQDIWDTDRHYVLRLYGPLDYNVAVKYNWTTTPTNILMEQDILCFLLSTISSEPVVLQQEILDSLYYAPDGEETIGFDEWAVVGDCMVRFDRSRCSSKQQYFTLNIKPIE